MTDTKTEKPEVHPIKMAASYSSFSPIIYVIIIKLFNPSTAPWHMPTSRKFVLAIIILSGFICGIIGLFGVKKYGKKGILNKSIFGIGANTFIILSFFYGMYLGHSWTERIKNTPLNISPPATFVDYSEGKRIPRVTHSYIKGYPTDNSRSIICLIEDIGGIIKNKNVDKKTIAKGNVSLEKTDWKEHQINVFRVIENSRKTQIITLNAQVPIIPNAIQVKIFGPKTREKEIREDLKKILKGIDGPTNW